MPAPRIAELAAQLQRARPAAQWVTDRLPRSAQHRVERAKHRWRYRTDLVPASALAQTYCDALGWLDEQGDTELGDYLEFGVCRGTSMICMSESIAETVPEHDIRLFGFDGFQGLPQEAADQDDGVWAAGWYDSDYDLTRRRLTAGGVDWTKTHLVKGWFSDTLTPALRSDHAMTKAGVIMIDCDLYSSSVEALEFCAPLIRGHAVVVFDDWNSFGLAERDLGEKRAWSEFLERNPDITVLKEAEPYASEAHVLYIRRD